MRDKLIQFGKKHIVNECFGPGYRTGNTTVYPAIRVNHSVKAEVKIDPLRELLPFTSGTEGEMWYANNCEECAKRHECFLLARIENAYFGEGKIPYKTANRIGYSRISIQSNGADIVDLTDCKEKI